MSEPLPTLVTLGERSKLKRDSVVTDPEYEDPETLILLQQKDDEIKKMQYILKQMQEKLRTTEN